MATILSKSLVSGIAVTGLTTAGVCIYYLTINNSKIEEKTISDWLKADGKSLLEDSANEDWKSNWTNFKEGKQKTQTLEEPWKLADWTTEFDKDVAPTSLKQKCKENAEIKIKDKDVEIYKNLIKFCTKQTS